MFVEANMDLNQAAETESRLDRCQSSDIVGLSNTVAEYSSSNSSALYEGDAEGIGKHQHHHRHDDSLVPDTKPMGMHLIISAPNDNTTTSSSNGGSSTTATPTCVAINTEQKGVDSEEGGQEAGVQGVANLVPAHLAFPSRSTPPNSQVRSVAGRDRRYLTHHWPTATSTTSAAVPKFPVLACSSPIHTPLQIYSVPLNKKISSGCTTPQQIVISSTSRRDVNAAATNVPLQFSLIWEAAQAQKARPLRRCFVRPTLPTQEDYLQRILINLLYYARNYVNYLFLCVMLLCVADPHFLVVFFLAGVVHFTQRNTRRRRAAAVRDNECTSGGTAEDPTQLRRVQTLAKTAKIVQLASCVATVYLVGFGKIILAVLLIAAPIIAHASLTSYSDAAYRSYMEAIDRRGITVVAPRSPTCGMQQVDPDFVEAFQNKPMRGSLTVKCPASSYDS